MNYELILFAAGIVLTLLVIGIFACVLGYFNHNLIPMRLKVLLIVV